MRYLFPLAASAACVALLSTAAFAGEVTGGAVNFGGTGPFDGDGASVGRLGVNAEVGFSQTAAVQADFNMFSSSEDESGTIFNTALHGIYHLDENTSFGAFAALDHSTAGNARSFGVEAGLESGIAEGELYFGTTSDGNETGTIVGGIGMFDVTPVFALGLGHDQLLLDSGDFATTELRAEYAIENFIVEANLGQLHSDSGDSDTYLGLGARITFGAERGATFNRRSTLNLIPGL